jgi:hypothetical protein
MLITKRVIGMLLVCALLLTAFTSFTFAAGNTPGQSLSTDEVTAKINAMLNDSSIKKSPGLSVSTTTATLATADVTTYSTYTSVQGQSVACYKITPSNPVSGKTIFLNFTLHGWEDAWERDGKALYSLASDVMYYYHYTNPSALNGTTVYMVACANPDGTFYGTNNYRYLSYPTTAYGRCTSQHKDMNR